MGFDLIGYTNLKLIGKGNPVITVPQNFTGFLFEIVSNNVTVQGLTIDGHGWLGTNTIPSTSAIRYNGSSGTIKDNTITGWHQPFSGNPPYTVTGGVAVAIQIIAVPAGKKLQILNNGVYDAQDMGIFISLSQGQVKVTGNRIVPGSGIVPRSFLGGGFQAQAGIAVVFSDPGVEVSGNQVLSDADLFPRTVQYSRGIMLLETSGAKVTGNTVRGTAAQITIENWCLFSMAANNNVISGNQLYDTFNVGVYLTVRSDRIPSCTTALNADNNQVTKNTIYTLDLNTNDNPFGLMAVYLEAVGSGVIDSAVVKDNTFAGFGLAPNSYTVRADSPNVLNLVNSPNRLLTLPPAGAYK
jgi:hypothetical protein